MANSKHALYYDVKLLFPVLFLVGLGIVLVYSASSALAIKKFGVDYYFLKKQAFFSMIGIVALVLCRHIPLKLFRSSTYIFLGLAICFLGAIFFSGYGVSSGGAKRWLCLAGITFQPSEFARFAMILYLAYSISKKDDRIKDLFIGFVPHVIVLSIISVMIFCQPDFGSTVLICTITWIMMFAGGVRILHLCSSLIIILPPLYLFMLNAPYRMRRLTSFLDPWKYQSDEGYQIVHSLMAFGTGGIWGTGIGKGYQKLFYLPEPHTDFIWSVIGEELGVFGVLIILGLYFIILIRGISISRNAKDSFSSLLALGITTAICLQACVHMSVALGLLPTKGLPLPFLSYGGTSLLFNMAAIGILLNIGSSEYTEYTEYR